MYRLLSIVYNLIERCLLLRGFKFYFYGKSNLGEGGGGMESVRCTKLVHLDTSVT